VAIGGRFPPNPFLKDALREVGFGSWFGSWAEDTAAAEHDSFTTRCGLRSGVASWHLDEFAI
jgi:hypothetical protein